MGTCFFFVDLFMPTPRRFTMGGGLESLRGLTKSIPAANRGRAPLGGLKRDFTLLLEADESLPNSERIRDQWIASRQPLQCHRQPPQANRSLNARHGGMDAVDHE